MLHKFQFPLLLIAGMTNAVQLDLPCETEATDCGEAGCDNSNDVDINIEFDVQAKQSGPHTHDAAMPTELDLELARILAELDESE
jgi:hypothetical protein